MKKYRYALFLPAVLVYLLTSCTQADTTGEKAEFILEVTSTVLAEDCYICGNGFDSLMPHYGEMDSIGIIYWNKPVIADTKVRAYEADGTERFHSGVMMMGGITPGDEHGSAEIYAFPDRGISEVSIHYRGNDEIDFDALRNILCQDCLNQVADLYINHKNHSEENTIGATGFSLVDFQTKKIYSISGPHVGYGIRDYYVRFFTNEILGEKNNATKDGTVELLIFYAPVREP